MTDIEEARAKIVRALNQTLLVYPNADPETTAIIGSAWFGLHDLTVAANHNTTLNNALQDACDVAVWLTGLGDLSDVPAWPEMREKLNRALSVLRKS